MVLNDSCGAPCLLLSESNQVVYTAAGGKAEDEQEEDENDVLYARKPNVCIVYSPTNPSNMVRLSSAVSLPIVSKYTLYRYWLVARDS